jgi:hypothetical protein
MLIICFSYITLPEEIIQSIWRDKRVGSRKLRSETYDRDDFSFAMKTAIGEWCHDNIRAPVGFCFFTSVEITENSFIRWL